MKIGWLISVTTGGSSLTKRLAFLSSKSAAGAGARRGQTHWEKQESNNHGSKKYNNYQNKTGNFCTFNLEHFSEIKIVAGYISVIFASILQLQILLISIRSTDEQFAGWVV
jgi:hypothetical protein